MIGEVEDAGLQGQPIHEGIAPLEGNVVADPRVELAGTQEIIMIRITGNRPRMPGNTQIAPAQTKRSVDAMARLIARLQRTASLPLIVGNVDPADINASLCICDRPVGVRRNIEARQAHFSTIGCGIVDLLNETGLANDLCSGG